MNFYFILVRCRFACQNIFIVYKSRNVTYSFPLDPSYLSIDLENENNKFNGCILNRLNTDTFKDIELFSDIINWCSGQSDLISTSSFAEFQNILIWHNTIDLNMIKIFRKPYRFWESHRYWIPSKICIVDIFIWSWHFQNSQDQFYGCKYTTAVLMSLLLPNKTASVNCQIQLFPNGSTYLNHEQ